MADGGMAEWTIAAVLKAAIPPGIVGSNPTPSASSLGAAPISRLSYLWELYALWPIGIDDFYGFEHWLGSLPNRIQQKTPAAPYDQPAAPLAV